MVLELAVAGLIIGIFIGMSGVGGGSIMTPVLVVLLGINPLAAVGTDLLYSVPTKIFGAVLHARQRTMNWPVVRWLLAGGAPGSVGALIVLYRLRHTMNTHVLDLWVRKGVGIALIVSAVFLVYGLFRLKKSNEAASEPEERAVRARALPLALSGALIGFFVTLTSIGSGAMTMPLLLVLVPFIGVRRLVGSDIAFAALLLPLAAAGHAALGDVNYRVAFALLLGSLPGVYIGSRLCSNVSEFILRPAVATVLIVAAGRMI